MDSETRTKRSNSGLALAQLKATVSPAQVYSQPVSITTHESVIPRDFTATSTKTSRTTSSSSTHGATHTSDDFTTHRRLSRVTEMLQRKASDSSPPQSPKFNSHFTLTESPYSSTDSLVSLVERQHQNKIIHPSHQTTLFNNVTQRRETFVDSQRRPSQASVLAMLQGRQKRTSAPVVKSPLHTEPTTAVQPSQAVRRLHSHNPHHVHSSPAVKESKKVSLGYDPVSRKKMLNSYEIVKEIGRGEHGKVKLAKHLETGELVAIKIVDRKGPRRSFKPGSSHEEKIRREIAIMKKISHPNVVQLKEVMDDANSRKIYLVLEYLEKGEVKWQKAPDVPLMTLKESMQVFRDVLLGLEYLHYQGIIHRDIKPANLLIDGDGSVKISDFGVSFASSLKSGEQDDYDLAKTAGTPAFLAPELCCPLEDYGDAPPHPKITYKIDIWALGVTLYCFLFGKLPFWATNEFELFDVICNKTLEFPETFPAEFTEEDKSNAVELLTAILDKDPKRRLTIKQIKRHPLTLRDLPQDDADIFTAVQESCQCKIDVSNEEVEVAVTGLGSKLRKGFAKALKFAGFPSRSASASTASTHDDHIHCDSVSCHHRRIKSGDISSETYASVEGDLFLNKGSALNSLNTIFNDDKSKASALSLKEGNSMSTSTSESYATSNNSSQNQMVSLPVNASFASLDSVYLDNYAPTYGYTSTADARAPPPPSSTRDVFSKMDNFELNKTTRKKSDDAVAPHVPAKFMLNDDGEEDDDSEHEDYGDDCASEFSVPSYIIQDLGGSTAEIRDTPARLPPTRPPPTRGAPHYSFFDASDSDELEEQSGPEVIFGRSSDEESIQVKGVKLEPMPELDHNNSDSSDEDGGELTLSFGRTRHRHNSIAVTNSSLRPHTEPGHPLQRIASPLTRNAPKTPVATPNAQSYSNHYHRVNPQVSLHPNDVRGRSNSITVGLLNHKLSSDEEQ